MYIRFRVTSVDGTGFKPMSAIDVPFSLILLLKKTSLSERVLNKQVKGCGAVAFGDWILRWQISIWLVEKVWYLH